MGLAIVRGEGTTCHLELEGRRLNEGDAVWVPTGRRCGWLVVDWRAATLRGVLWDARALVVEVEGGGRELLCFDAGLRRRHQR